MSHRYTCTGCSFVTDTLADLIENCCPHCGEDIKPEEGEVEVHTVNVGYYGQQFSNVIVVKSRPGTPIEKVCELAIDRANNDSGGWRSTDHVTDSFVNAIAKGEPNNADADHLAVPVPLTACEGYVLLDPVNQAKLRRYDDLVELCRQAAQRDPELADEFLTAWWAGSTLTRPKRAGSMPVGPSSEGACCANEKRSVSGGCVNCGDPAL